MHASSIIIDHRSPHSLDHHDLYDDSFEPKSMERVSQVAT
jgi:hypothetical protein